ncbi:uncharacterized protein [Acropora muricata]|uniref:uncharacterized protein n=1 Tax=Acropora muricata TaxID=159855 RepID=UPI0034E3E247
MRSNPNMEERSYKRLLKLTVQLLILTQLMAPCYAFQAPRKSFVKFHPIKKNIHYRLWNPVRNGWVMKDPNDMSLAYCSCGFNSQDYNKTLIQTKHTGPGLFDLVFTGTNGEPDLHIATEEEGRGLVLTSSPSAYTQFEPLYYWGYTLFRSRIKSNAILGMYIGSDETNTRATLLLADEDNNFAAYYPNPQSLFIVTKVKLA